MIEVETDIQKAIEELDNARKSYVNDLNQLRKQYGPVFYHLIRKIEKIKIEQMRKGGNSHER